jgi:deoxyribodipyrimidine photo-lyase
MYTKALFVFRKSLRLHDNTGLIQALKNTKKVIPSFIFTPEQIRKNSYKSNKCVQFMIESLHDLNTQLEKHHSRLFYFFGPQEKVIETIIKKENIDAIFVNNDYTAYAIKRDKKIATICKKYNVAFKSHDDIMLHSPNTIQNSQKKPFVKFTPYLSKAIRTRTKKPVQNRYQNYINKHVTISGEYKKKLSAFYKENKDPIIKGGRKNATKILKKIKKYKIYEEQKDFLTYQTTMLSAFIKFGCISIREVYEKIKTNKALLRQLYWHDFYYTISHFFPHIYKGALNKKYDKIKWSKNTKHFTAWQKGKTGFPVVDACMRQLNQTGFITNRARLIVSNFLAKILLIHWRKGEKYFATKLIDYDPAVNNGNWQWVAGCGASAQPYFRTLNPLIQSKKYDKNGNYIKKWIPELKNVSNHDLHQWHSSYKKYQQVKYPKPIINYGNQKNKMLNTYKIFTKS